jgi:hypothetical protein
MADHEKTAPGPTAVEHVNDLHEFNEREGYVLTDTEHANLKRAGDGQTILLPQPSDDKNDPLNWSWAKKHTILIIISMTAFLPDVSYAKPQHLEQFCVRSGQGRAPHVEAGVIVLHPTAGHCATINGSHLKFKEDLC